MAIVFFSSTLKDDLQYTPSDCFETFPFSEGWETDAALEAAGRKYYEFRAELMVRHNEGLTKTYRRFAFSKRQRPAWSERLHLPTLVHRAEG